MLLLVKSQQKFPETKNHDPGDTIEFVLSR